MTKHSDYILSVNEDGAKMLEMQNQIFAENSFAQVTKAGLTEGMTVYDIGCGNGFMTQYFATQVGGLGKVYAVDYSQEQLDRTRARLEQSDKTNVEYIKCDIMKADNLPLRQADLVYARFVLMHLTDPMAALTNMYNLLKPGGVLVLQESTFNTVQKTPPLEIIYDIIQVFIKIGDSKGVDYNIGRKLQDYAAKLAFTKTAGCYKELYRSVKESCEFYLNRLKEVRLSLLESGLVNEQQIESWAEEFEQIASTDDDRLLPMGEQSYLIAWR